MTSLIRRLLDALGIFGFVYLLGFLYREQISGTIIGDVWESVHHLLFGWVGN